MTKTAKPSKAGKRCGVPGTVSKHVYTPPYIVNLLLGLVARLCCCSLGIKPNTAGWHVRGKRAKYETMSAKRQAALKHTVKMSKDTLLVDEERKAATMFDVMSFPGANESEQHVQRLIKLIGMMLSSSTKSTTTTAASTRTGSENYQRAMISAISHRSLIC